MTELHYAEGKENNYQNIIKKFGQADWYWYEPKPESLLEAKDQTKKLASLKKDEVNIPDGIQFSELMLFYTDAGLSIVNTGNGYNYFYWNENSTSETKNPISPVEKKTENVLARDMKTFKQQFGIDLYDTLANAFQLVRYYHDNQCIAWTLFKKEEKNNDYDL